MNDEPLLKKPRLASSDRVKLLKQAEADPAGFIADRGLELVGEWLQEAVSSQETGLVHACLGCLEKLPMTLDLLQSSKIGRLLNESMKPCSNQVAIERARKLLNGWKLIVGRGTSSPPSSEPKELVSGEVIAPPPTTRKTEIVEEQVHEEVTQEESKGVMQEDDNAVDALASLLESLPDIEALIDAEPGKRGIKWKPDSQLVQMVEFGILETCEDLRRRIDETHGGLSSLHPHGQDTAEEMKRFQESRKKERAMGGNRLRMQLLIDEDDAEDLEVFLPAWVWPIKVKVLAQDAVYDPKKVMSYERQDLADMHGSRPEVIYGPGVKIPDTPSEPSNSFKLQRNDTIEVLLGGSGEEPIDLEPAAPPSGQASGQSTPGSSGSLSEVTSFDDEFVKLDSKLQTVILGSEDLLQLFMRDPSLLRGLTLEKLELITSELRKPPFVPKTVSHTVHAHVDDRKGWGASTIRTAVRQEVMSSFVPPPPGPGYPYPPAPFPGSRGAYEPPHMPRGSPPTYTSDHQHGAFPQSHHGHPPPDYGYNRGPPQHAPPDYGYNRGPPPNAPPPDYGYSRGPPSHGPPPQEYGYNRGPAPNAPPPEYGYHRGPPPSHAPPYPPRRSPRR